MKRHYGATLIEGLISASVLIIGVVGILIMLQSAATSTRDAATAYQAALFASTRLEATTALGYCALADAGYATTPPPTSTPSPPGTPLPGSDGGVDVDMTGRTYAWAITVDPVNPPPGANANPTFRALQVTVTSRWVTGIQLERITRMSSIVTRAFDAGCSR